MVRLFSNVLICMIRSMHVPLVLEVSQNNKPYVFEAVEENIILPTGESTVVTALFNLKN